MYFSSVGSIVGNPQQIRKPNSCLTVSSIAAVALPTIGGLGLTGLLPGVGVMCSSLMVGVGGFIATLIGCCFVYPFLREECSNLPFLSLAEQEAIINAAKSGDSEFIRACLSKGAMEELFLGEAVIQAVNSKQVGIVELLLSDQRMISQQDLATAVLVAARNGQRDMIPILLSERRVITEEQLKQAATFAILNNHPLMILVLLSDERRLSPKNLANMIVAAAVSKNEQLFTFLLQHGGFSQGVINQDVYDAVAEVVRARQAALASQHRSGCFKSLSMNRIAPAA